MTSTMADRYDALKLEKSALFAGEAAKKEFFVNQYNEAPKIGDLVVCAVFGCAGNGTLLLHI